MLIKRMGAFQVASNNKRWVDFLRIFISDNLINEKNIKIETQARYWNKLNSAIVSTELNGNDGVK